MGSHGISFAIESFIDLDVVCICDLLKIVLFWLLCKRPKRTANATFVAITILTILVKTLKPTSFKDRQYKHSNVRKCLQLFASIRIIRKGCWLNFDQNSYIYESLWTLRLPFVLRSYEWKEYFINFLFARSREVSKNV